MCLPFQDISNYSELKTDKPTRVTDPTTKTSTNSKRIAFASTKVGIKIKIKRKKKDNNLFFWVENEEFCATIMLWINFSIAGKKGNSKMGKQRLCQPKLVNKVHIYNLFNEYKFPKN